MGRYARKIVFDAKRGECVEITPDGVREVCDQISAASEPYREGLEFGLPRERTVAKWPIHCEAMACNAEDIPLAKEKLRQCGVRAEFDSLCRPILENQKHAAKVAKALGFYHRNGGYGDAAPDNYVESTHSQQAAKRQRDELRRELRHHIARIESELGI